MNMVSLVYNLGCRGLSRNTAITVKILCVSMKTVRENSLVLIVN